MIALAALILVTIIIGMGLGPASLSYDRLLPTLLGNGTFPESFVLFDVRLPALRSRCLPGWHWHWPVQSCKASPGMT